MLAEKNEYLGISYIAYIVRVMYNFHPSAHTHPGQRESLCQPNNKEYFFILFSWYLTSHKIYSFTIAPSHRSFSECLYSIQCVYTPSSLTLVVIVKCYSGGLGWVACNIVGAIWQLRCHINCAFAKYDDVPMIKAFFSLSPAHENCNEDFFRLIYFSSPIEKERVLGYEPCSEQASSWGWI